MSHLSKNAKKIIASLILLISSESVIANPEVLTEALDHLNTNMAEVGIVDSICPADCIGNISEVPQTAIELFENVKTQMGSCKEGERIDVHFQSVISEASFSNSLTVFTLNTNLSSTENVTDTYTGVSNFNDIMVVSKTSSSENYTVSISFCPFGSTLNKERVISQVSAEILLTANGIYALETKVYLEEYGFIPSVWFGPTTFFPVSLKGSSFDKHESIKL